VDANGHKVVKTRLDFVLTVTHTATGPIESVAAADLHADLRIVAGRGRSLRVALSDDASDIAVDELASPGDAVRRLLVRGMPGREHSAGGLPQVEIEVPEGTAIDLRRVTGTISVGDTRGHLTLEVGGHTRVRAGAVGTVRMVAAGDARVTIAHVHGTMRVDVVDRARVRAAGKVRSLDAHLFGSGDLDFNGIAGSAELSVRGTGHISVTQVQSTLLRHCVGSGDIRVANPPHAPFATA
jgi:hypothetical protein